jgi:hypothetical protein
MGFLVDLASVLGCVLPTGGGVYASAPLTSGMRFLQAGSESSTLELESARKRARDKNVAAARHLAAMLRAVHGTRVIDPSSFPHFTGWTQDHYYLLWGEVIRRHTECAVFIDDWEYSKGCTYEYAVAVASGVQAYSARLNSLSTDEAVDRIRAAIREIERFGRDSAFFRERLDDVRLRRFPVLNVGEPPCSEYSRPHVCASMVGCVVRPKGAVMFCPATLRLSPNRWWGQGIGLIGLPADTGFVLPPAFQPLGWAEAEVLDLWREVLNVYCCGLVVGDEWSKNELCTMLVNAALAAKVRVVDKSGVPADLTLIHPSDKKS